MKAITIKHPFASLIVSGLKEYAFRTWKTKYRWEILIHSAQTVGKEAMKRFALYHLDYPLGCLLVKAELTDCVDITDEVK